MTNYFPQPYRYQPMNNGFRVVSIANETEINSIADDYSGIPIYFHNRATNEIIIKQFDIKTGLTTIQKYVKSDGTEGQISKENVKSDVDYSENFNAINERIDGLKSMIENLNISKPEIIEARGGKK